MAFIPSSASGGGSKLRKGFAGRAQRRACYVMWSKTSSGDHYVFYDENFNMIIPAYNNYTTRNYVTASNVVQYHSGTFTTENTMGYSGWGSSNSYPSSGGTTYASMFAFNAMNGSAAGYFYSDGSATTSRHPSYASDNKLRNARMFFPSDHANRAIMYGYEDGYVFARHVNKSCREDLPFEGTKDVGISGVSMSQGSGMAAYNNTRKEFICVKLNNGSGSFDINKFTNWDFDTYPSPAAALANATLDFTYTVQHPSWGTTDLESEQNHKLILRDDGQIHAYVQHNHSSGFRCYYWDQPATDPGATINTTHAVTLTNTTSYGRDQAQQYGQRIVSSRDGRNYCFMAPYYYYWSGSLRHFTGMGETAVGPSISLSDTNTSFGMHVLPFRDDGFIHWYPGNGYASNPTGAFLYTGVRVGGINQVLESNGNEYRYLPMWHGSNTTNYPAMAAVDDYRLFKYGDGSSDNSAYNEHIRQG